MIYGLLGMGLALLLALGYAKIEHSGKLEAESKVEACNTKIEAQNLAVQQLKTDSDRKIATATQGVAKAKAGTAKARSEAERLRVLAGQSGAPGACPAGAAVAEVRKGL